MRRWALAVALAATTVWHVAHADAIDDAFSPWTGPDRPGCVLAYAQRGKPAETRAYGMADLEHGVANSADTVFETGSVAKQVTAAAVLMLVEQGKLRLDDDIRRYLPEMPDYGPTITIDQLLMHTSGLRDWSDLADFTGWPRYSRVYSNADALALLARQKSLNHASGTRFSYTNSGYNLLAVIVERASGQSLAAFTRAHVFAVLGMTHSRWRDDFREIVPDRAIGYVTEGNRLVQGLPMENAYGSGGMLTTAGDLLRWVQGLDAGALGPFVTGKLQEVGRLENGSQTNYGRGLELAQTFGQREIYHNGGTNGYQAWAGRYPDAGLAIAMLCNGRTIGPDTQARRTAALLLSPTASTPVSTAPPAEELAIRPGVYLSEGPFERLDIAAREGNLAANGAMLRFESPGHYRLGGQELVFGKDEVVRVRRPAEQTALHRIVAERPNAKDLARIEGRYENVEVGGLYDVTISGENLLLHPTSRSERIEVYAPITRELFAGNGTLLRVLRSPNGTVRGLRFSTARVYGLEFSRVTGRRRH